MKKLGRRLMSVYFENKISVKDFFFKYALGKSALSGEEFHEYDELVYYIDGGARLISKNVQMVLPSESLVFIPRETFHQFVIADEDNYKRCILHFYGHGEHEQLMREVAYGVRVVSTPSQNTRRIFDFLSNTARVGVSERDGSLLLSSAFAEILLEEKLFSKGAVTNNSTTSVLSGEALDYIDKNYASDIRVEDVARALKVSTSSLAHSFKRDFSISVYRYITEKRLSSVRALVDSGMGLSNAALQCGFRDYSSFYRLYKKQYGESPSEKKREKQSE